MPSIQDIADQINAKLDSINVNTAQTVVVSEAIRDGVSALDANVTQLDAHTQTSLTNISQGIFAVWEIQKASLTQLQQQTEQGHTLICLIENTNELLCGITRKLTKMNETAESVEGSIRRVEGIMERTEASAAGDYDRHLKIQQELAECCPPPKPEPEPCPEACKQRTIDPYRPDGQKWKPLTERDPIG